MSGEETVVSKARSDPGENGAAPPDDRFLRDTSESTPARRRFLAIHHVMRERIALLHYPPGSRLDVDALSREFGVSRTPIRSVLQRLEYEGLVVTRHGVGTRVTEVDFPHLREATEFRMRLAELIGELSPLPPSAQCLERLERARDACRDLKERFDKEGFARVDLEVHECVCSLIGHPQLFEVYDELYYRTARMWFALLPRLDWQEEISVFLEDIELQLRALRRGDVRGVGFLVRNALSAVLHRVMDHVDPEWAGPAPQAAEVRGAVPVAAGADERSGEES